MEFKSKLFTEAPQLVCFWFNLHVETMSVKHSSEFQIDSSIYEKEHQYKINKGNTEASNYMGVVGGTSSIQKQHTFQEADNLAFLKFYVEYSKNMKQIS